MDDTAQKQIVEILQKGTNVLVTVSANPSVDQLSAMIGLTLLLNKADKHGTAVFSGQVPSTLEFLEPEHTVEKNTDSLRDFIIALDKSKADKLRYKVEDDVVKIFITPYRTSLTGEDFEFSQGDFNVDVVVAIGVTQRDDLDKAIVAHGRILHDAKVVTFTTGNATSDLGGVNWQNTKASSLCEMIATMAESMQAGLLDPQISTALLTGIVAETERFRNEKTSPQVMTLAAQLMAAGANQQLIAAKLEPILEPPVPAHMTTAESESPTPVIATEEKEAGVLHLDHEAIQVEEPKVVEATPIPAPSPVIPPLPPAPIVPTTPPITQSTEVEPDAQPVPVVAEPITVPAEVPAPKEQPATATQEAPVPERAEVKLSNDSGYLGEIHIDEHGNLGDPLSDDKDKSTINHGIKVIAPPDHTDDVPKTDLSTLILDPPALGSPFNSTDADKSHEPAPAATSVDPAYQSSVAKRKTLDLQAPSILDMIPPALDFTLHDSPAPAALLPTVDSAQTLVTDAINAAPFDPAHPEPLEAINATPVDLQKDEPTPEDKPTPPTTPPPPVPPPMMPATPASNPFLNPAAVPPSLQ